MTVVSQRAVLHLLRLVTALHLAIGQVHAAVAAADEPGRIKSVRLGLANHYKVGHWTPVWVELNEKGVRALLAPRIEVTVDDSDGVATKVSAALQTIQSGDGSPAALAYTKVGRSDATITVTVNDGERELDRTTVRPGTRATANRSIIELTATTELIVTLGNAAPGLPEALGERDSAQGERARRVVRLEYIDDLPLDWFGYESVDVIVLDAVEPALLRELAADERRQAALARWIELGGRMVVLAGGRNAEEMLAEDGPLSAFSPGRLAQVVRLPETAPLEQFAQAEALPAPATRQPIFVPQLKDVEGNIEVHAGRRPTDLPLVVRSPRGLGEITFAGVDLSAAPLSDWSDRRAFLQSLMRPYVAEGADSGNGQTLVTRGYSDLSGALRQRLGQSFPGVAPFGFAIVALLAIAYLVVLGPLDYLLVHRWLRRPWVAWLTLPAIVLLFGVGALVLADWRGGGAALRINSIELVDVDSIGGHMRGTCWATIYSPQAAQFDITLQVDPLDQQPISDREVLLSWWGLPGVGIGGMQAGGAQLRLARGEYRYGQNLDVLRGVPVLTSSTKSLLARWTAPSGPQIYAQLQDEDGLAQGSLENRSRRTLRNVRLFYKNWAHSIGILRPGQRVELSEQSSPRLVKTLVMQQVLGGAAARDGGAFAAERATAEQVLNLIMFYRLAGGSSVAGLPNSMQNYCDLSRQLNLGRAVIVAEADGGSRLVPSHDGTALANVQESQGVLYRVVLPVIKNERP